MFDDLFLTTFHLITAFCCFSISIFFYKARNGTIKMDLILISALLGLISLAHLVHPCIAKVFKYVVSIPTDLHITQSHF